MARIKRMSAYVKREVPQPSRRIEKFINGTKVALVDKLLDTNEYRVRLLGYPDADYFTDDLIDAKQTALAMIAK